MPISDRSHIIQTAMRPSSNGFACDGICGGFFFKPTAFSANHQQPIFLSPCLQVQSYFIWKEKKKSEECISATDRNNEFRVFRDEMLCSPQCVKIEEKGTPKNDKIFEIFLGPKNTLWARLWRQKQRERKKIMQYQMRNLECQIFSINQTDSLISRHFLRQKTFFLFQSSLFFLSGEERRNFYLSLRIFRPFLSFPIWEIRAQFLSLWFLIFHVRFTFRLFENPMILLLR